MAEIYSLAEQSGTFKFVKTSGLVLKTETIFLYQGLNKVPLDVSGLENGVLLLSVMLENGRKLLGKVVKVN